MLRFPALVSQPTSDLRAIYCLHFGIFVSLQHHAVIYLALSPAREVHAEERESQMALGAQMALLKVTRPLVMPGGSERAAHRGGGQARRAEGGNSTRRIAAVGGTAPHRPDGGRNPGIARTARLSAAGVGRVLWPSVFCHAAGMLSNIYCRHFGLAPNAHGA